jgi:beta-N-acetylglucosaminidase/Glycosyl hydrolase family 20, domain 2
MAQIAPFIKIGTCPENGDVVEMNMQRWKFCFRYLGVLAVVGALSASVWAGVDIWLEGEDFIGVGSVLKNARSSNSAYRFVHNLWSGSASKSFTAPKHGFYQVSVAMGSKDPDSVLNITVDGTPLSGMYGSRGTPYGIVELDAGVRSVVLLFPASPASTLSIDYIRISDEFLLPFSTVDFLIEGEDLTSSVGSSVYDTQCSGGFCLQVNSGESGAATGSFDVPAKDYYEIAASLSNSDTSAIISITIDGTTITGNQGKGIYEPDSFGIVDLDTGTHSISVSFPSAPAATIRLDYIRVRNYADGPNFVLPPSAKNGKPIVVPEPKETEWGGGLYLMDRPAIVQSSDQRDTYATAELQQFCEGLGFSPVPILTPDDDNDSYNVLFVLGDPTPNASTAVEVYQEDVSNSAYATTSDCWIQSESGGTTDQGQRAEMRMRSGDRHSIVAFRDIIGINSGQIKSGSSITSAKLKLFMYANYAGLDAYAYRLLRDWGNGSEGTELLNAVDNPGEFGCTWYNASEVYGGSTTAWESVGCQGALDRTQSDMDHVNVLQSAGPGIWVEFDVTEAVQAWSNGEPNYGVFLDCAGGNAYFFSADNGNDSLNPILEVIYDPNSTLPPPPGSVADYLDQLGVSALWSQLGQQGYLLAVKRMGTRTVVTIAGEDEPGVYYGVQTFKQWPLVTPLGGYAISEVVLRDWPDYLRRGVVGPSMNLTRLDLITSLKENYSFLTRSLKDWYSPIPQSEKDALTTFSQECAMRYVTPVAGMKPDYSGIRLHYSDTAHIDIMKQAYEDYYNCGYLSLWIAFDDLGNVGRESLYYADDIATFGHTGNAHKYLLQQVYDHLYAIDPNITLYTVPMEYYELDDDAQEYLEQWSDLPDSVVVFNCSSIRTQGPDYFSPIFFETYVGRKPILWDNYVSGFEVLNPIPTLFPPLDNLYTSPDLPLYLEGYSFPIVGDISKDNMLYTMTADYMWNGLNYDAARSAMRARAMRTQGPPEIVTEGVVEQHPLKNGWTLFSTQTDPAVAWNSCEVTDGIYTFSAEEAAKIGWIEEPYFFDPVTQEYVSVSDGDGMLYWDTGYWLWTNHAGITLTIK